jgi:ABC-type nitrate/sulfonate/bicarbonate transport system substrate-binding protein
VAVVLSTSPFLVKEKEDLFRAFLKALNKIEKRIQRQKDGQAILGQVYS